MPSYQHNPTGVRAGLAQRISEHKTRIRSAQLGSAVAVEIWQSLIAKLPWGHITRVLAGVNGRHLEPGRSRGALPGRVAANS